MVRVNQAIQSRSYPVGSEHYHRLFQHDSLMIEIAFREESSPPVEILLYVENLSSGKVQSSEIFLQGGPREFKALIPTDQCGVNRFKIKYQLNHQWFWDSVPFSYFIVDPIYIKDMRVYTLIPSASGHIGDWKKDLERIRNLGFNMIHLLPLTKMDTSESPYAATDLFSIDTSYTDPNDPRDGLSQFEDFVQTVCDYDMRLCLDLVFNSIGVHSNLSQYRPEWLVEDSQEPDGIKRAGWNDGKRWHKWLDLVLLNYEPFCNQTRKKLWQYMTEYALFWSRYAAKTHGMIRLDNLHSSHEGFTKHVLSKIREAHPELIVFGELFETEERIEQLVLDYGLNLLLATQWEHKFVPELREYIEYLHRKSDKVRYFSPISSHDSDSPAEEFGNVESTTPRLAISMLFGAGPSGITQGVEFGCSKRIEFIGRQGRVQMSGEKDFNQLIEKLNNLIKNNDIFQIPGNLRFIDKGHNAILGACRIDPKTQKPRFLLFVNLDISNDQQITVDIKQQQLDLSDALLRDALNDSHQRFSIEDDKLPIHLAPCEISILEIV
jgi:hypothetical protein